MVKIAHDRSMVSHYRWRWLKFWFIPRDPRRQARSSWSPHQPLSQAPPGFQASFWKALGKNWTNLNNKVFFYLLTLFPHWLLFPSAKCTSRARQHLAEVFVFLYLYFQDTFRARPPFSLGVRIQIFSRERKIWNHLKGVRKVRMTVQSLFP